MNDTADGDTLSGLRVLVVEDEAAIALLFEDMLLDFGCEVVGCVARLAKALDVVATTPIDFAIIDLNLAGEQAHPLAEELQRRGISFLISTGYGAGALGAQFETAAILPKPFIQSDLKAGILTALRGRNR